MTVVEAVVCTYHSTCFLSHYGHCHS